MHDGGFEEWTTPTDLRYWSELAVAGSSVNRESVDVYDGNYAVRLDVDALGSDLYVSQARHLVSGKEYVLSLHYKNPDAGKQLRIVFQVEQQSIWLDIDGNWHETVDMVWITLPDSAVWTRFAVKFKAHYADTLHTLWIYHNRYVVSTSLYFDLAELKAFPRITTKGYIQRPQVTKGHLCYPHTIEARMQQGSVQSYLQKKIEIEGRLCK